MNNAAIDLIIKILVIILLVVLILDITKIATFS